MNKFILAALATVALSSVAHAAPMRCLVNRTTGQEAAYMFERFGNGDLQELSFELEADNLTHRADRRPLWRQAVRGGMNALTYKPDPSYVLVMRNRTQDIGNDIDATPVRLFQDGRVLGTGACGVIRQRRSPAYTGQVSFTGSEGTDSFSGDIADDRLN